MMDLLSLFTIYCNGEGISHIFLSLGEQWQGPELQARLIVPNCKPSCRPSNLVEGIPKFLKALYYRAGENAPRQKTEKRFLREIHQFDAAYLWPATSVNILRTVKQQGKTLFLERINCYTGKAKLILDEAYERLGVSPQHPNTDEVIAREQEEMSLADFVFCPSPEVKKSFLEAGVPEQKLILTSYGWCPKRFSNLDRQTRSTEEVTVLFMGSICVRKGAHLLLKAWEQAGIKGRLMLCGSLEPVIAEMCSNILARPEVIHVNYTRDISFAYREADIFAFPSLEEGGPLVTYEAMAHGLPVLTSPMGAGTIVRDGIDGFIVPPYDQEAWVERLRVLASSQELRTQFSASARERAAEFTWEKVARRRSTLILEKMKAA